MSLKTRSRERRGVERAGGGWEKGEGGGREAVEVMRRRWGGRRGVVVVGFLYRGVE